MKRNLDDVRDPRDPRGKRWKLSTLLRAVLGGLLAGATLFRSVTQRSDERRSAPWKRLMLQCLWGRRPAHSPIPAPSAEPDHEPHASAAPLPLARSPLGPLPATAPEP